MTARTLLLTLCVVHCAGAYHPVYSQGASPVDFAHDIVPILRRHCAECHTGDKKQGGFSFNDRAALVGGGESGTAVVIGQSGRSDLIARITTTDKALKMPPEGPRVGASDVALLQRWIDGGLVWEEGFAFRAAGYEPPLAPRRPELPAVTGGRQNPVDRIIDAYLVGRSAASLPPLGDEAFLRRASLDLVGLLPTPERREAFLADARPDKREVFIQELLAEDVAYAEHWLTFWNDLLRNDYTGTGFITGGRKQITKWLYESLVTNKPYDKFARELIAPSSADAEGFIQGIKWRGEVSAGQTVEIQFAQSVAQSFLGINLKCASCHDSFIDRWKLAESFGLAAVYATRPLEIHRCDKPIGQTAKAAWLFPELGQIDPAAPQPERLQRLAELLTHPENGRFTRTIVNRLWHRLMGRGIVHPTDSMQTEPWNADLLDYLAVHLAESGYDLKQTLALIATSQAYQSRAQMVEVGLDDAGYTYAGPRAKRLTAEQFLDSVWQLTAAAPTRFDAPVLRGKPDPAAQPAEPLQGKWIWSRVNSRQSPAGETVAFRKEVKLPAAPVQAVAVMACDNSYVLFVNGKRAQAGDNWQTPDAAVLTSQLKAGANEFLIVAKNAGQNPNAAALFFEARITFEKAAPVVIASDETWEWSHKQPNANGRYAKEPADWQAAALASDPEVWSKRVGGMLGDLLARAGHSADLMVRASLVKSDFLMRSLGRPNRDQIVSLRPSELTTLEAIDLSNGQTLASALERGAKNLLVKPWDSPTQFVSWLYRFALSREPTSDERAVMVAAMGENLTEEGIEDALWSVLMLPEFQLVR